eukprot:1159812-Pleurochrysis_carterae.AAC.1
MADTGSEQANNDLQVFRDRFKLTMQDTPRQFLGMNIDMRKDGGVKSPLPHMSKRKRRPICQSLLPTTRSTRPPRHRS